MSEADATPGLDLVAIRRWFAEQVDGFTGEFVEASLLHGGRSNLTYGLGDGTHRWVLRRPPLGLVAPSANDVAREYRFIEAIAGTDVPVPAPVSMCVDTTVIGTPFTVVERVEGTVVRTADDMTALGDRAPVAMKVLMQTMADLHRVDVTKQPFTALGKATGYTRRQVDRWRRQWELVRTHDLPSVDELHRRLADTVPDHSATALIHGDYRIDNVILTRASTPQIAAVIDWEMAALGDPLADLALAIVYWNPVSGPIFADGHVRTADPRLPDHAALIEWYADASGANLDSLDFYLALASFKLAVIAEGIHRRYVDGDTIGVGFETVGDAVEPLAELGLTYVAPHK